MKTESFIEADIQKLHLDRLGPLTFLRLSPLEQELVLTGEKIDLKMFCSYFPILIHTTKTQNTDNYILKYSSSTFVYHIHEAIKNKCKKLFYKVLCWRMRMLGAFSFLENI